MGREAMDEQSKKLKADLLAGEILQMAYASLLLHLRFMESALGRLSFSPMPKGSVVRIGSFVDAEDDAVRPAMWVREREA